MGHVRGEPALELAIALQGLGHVVEGLAQLTQVVIARKTRAGREVALLDALGRLRDGAHWPGEGAREHKPHEHGQHHRGHGRQSYGLKGAVAKALVALGQQQVGAVGPHAHDAHLLARLAHDGGHDHVGLFGRQGDLVVKDDGAVVGDAGAVVEHHAVGVQHLDAHAVGRSGAGGRGVDLGGAPVTPGVVHTRQRSGRGLRQVLHGGAGVRGELVVPDQGENHHEQQRGAHGHSREGEGHALPETDDAAFPGAKAQDAPTETPPGRGRRLGGGVLADAMVCALGRLVPRVACCGHERHPRRTATAAGPRRCPASNAYSLAGSSFLGASKR